MPTGKTWDATISVHGAVNPDLQRSLGLTTQELSKMQSFIKGLNQLAAKSNVAFNGLPNSLQKSVGKIDEMTEKTSKLQSVLSNVSQLGAGVGIGEMIAKGFDMAVSAAEKLRDLVGESIQKAADFQRTQEQLGIEMGVGMGSPQAKELLSKLQYYSDTSPFQMSGVSESMRMLLSTGFRPDQAMNVLKQIGDVAAATTPSGMSATEHLKQLDEAVNKAIKGGALLERTLYMFEDAGVQIRPFLEKKLGMDPGSIGDLHDEANQTALAKQIKKRNVSSNLILDFLADVTGNGGKYEGGAFKMSHDFLGAQSTLIDKVDTFMRGIGDAFMGPLTTLMNKINDSFSWDRFKSVQQFFDDVAAKSNAAFGSLIDKLANANWDAIGRDGMKAVDAFAKMFEKAQPLMDWFADDLPKDIDGLLRLTTAFEKVATAIENAFAWVIGSTTSSSNGNNLDAFLFGKGLTTQQGGYGVHMFADGGIVNGATLGVVGESGPEAVIPLSALSDSPLLRDSVDATQAWVDAMNRFTGQLSSGFNFGSGYGSFGGSSGGSSSDFTVFGPGVPGDQPGGPTYDWNSYHGIGAYGRLHEGDAAMHTAYARSHYGIEPGQVYRSDKDGKLHRWMDKTGSKNFQNEDVYKGASINANFHVHAFDSQDVHRFFSEHASTVAKHIRRAFQDDMSSSAIV